jgi:hypothetical protein
MATDPHQEEMEEVEYYDRTHPSEVKEAQESYKEQKLQARQQSKERKAQHEVEDSWERHQDAEARRAAAIESARRRDEEKSWQEEVEYSERRDNAIKNRPLAWRAADKVSNSSPVLAAQRIYNAVSESKVGKAARSTTDAVRSTRSFFSSPPPNRKAPSLHQDDIPFFNQERTYPTGNRNRKPPAVHGIYAFNELRSVGLGREPPLGIPMERPFFGAPSTRRNKSKKSHSRKR